MRAKADLLVPAGTSPPAAALQRVQSCREAEGQGQASAWLHSRLAAVVLRAWRARSEQGVQAVWGRFGGAADGRYREKPLARQRYLEEQQQQKITQNQAPNMAPLLS